MKTQPCPECKGGTVKETLRYAEPPGDAIWENARRAYPPMSTAVRGEVKADRRCCRCGGSGELPVKEEE